MWNTTNNAVKVLSDTESLLMLTQHWYQNDEETFRARGEDDEPDTLVPISVLAEHHPLLPAALSASIAYSIKARADGRLVMDTIDLLKNGSITLKDTSGAEQVFTEIDSVESCDESSDKMYIGGIRVQLKWTEVEGKSVPFVINSRWENICFFKADLEAAYPEWGTRFKVGVGLGLEDKALAQHMFSPERQLSPTPVMSEVAFD